jgi:hypothetical protein
VFSGRAESETGGASGERDAGAENLRADRHSVGTAEQDEPLAGKSALNRMELGTGINGRYKKITYWKEAIDALSAP